MSFNRLQNEKSPYLLQHSQNPVDWHPWGEEAFEKARKDDKPIFLSIGYSTCHWCHVMERESFEDEEVARLLNDTFVNIKVDREERPDIDAVYMKVCQLMTQSGGWPLTIMMTHDKKPFFAATYIPRETKYGRVGLLEMIPEVETLWRTKRPDVVSAARDITRALQRQAGSRGEDIGEEVLHQAYRSLSMSFDKTFGGFGPSPKFPTPHHLLFLLRYWRRTGEAQALHMTEQTLRNMRRGGIYDQIGFGFHRYSTDAQWIVPHFEKMLYDQALTALAFIELYQATGKKEYEISAREIFTYVLRDMTDAAGGFYCAEDADSEGVEGKFYLWTEAEIRSILTKAEADLFLSHYRHPNDASAPGMQEIPAGSFIAHLKPAAGEEADEGFTRLTGKMEDIRKKLFAVREKRVHPHKDDKILTDWNGLMIAALARGAQVFDDSDYRDAAVRAMNFVTASLQDRDGRLLHRFRDGEAVISANIDDYSFVIWALLELYESTFETQYLTRALEYQSHLFAYFRDENNGGFFFTPADAEELPTRPKELYDGAVPSGNSMAFINALRLSRMTGDVELDERARDVYRAFLEQVAAMPTGFTQFLCGLDFAIGPPCEVVIVGKADRPDTQALLKKLRNVFAPNKVVIFKPDSALPTDIDTLASFAQPYQSINGQATAYVCSNFTCALPTNDAEQMIALLSGMDGE